MGDLALRKAVGDLVAAGHTRLVLDLGGVRYIDGAGIGGLMACQKLARGACAKCS